jgi:hypothetical protein
MEQKYWLARKRESKAMAWRATSAEARLIHFHLAGCYSVKAATCGAGIQLFAPAAEPVRPERTMYADGEGR